MGIETTTLAATLGAFQSDFACNRKLDRVRADEDLVADWSEPGGLRDG